MPRPTPHQRCRRWKPRVAVLVGMAIAGTLVGNGVWLAAQEVPAAADSQPTARRPIDMSLENSHLGYTYVGAGGLRYFVTQVSLTNHSEQDLTIPPAAFELVADGIAFAPDVDPQKLIGYDFRVNGKSRRFRDLPAADVVPLSPGATGTTWLVFSDLPKSPGIPRMTLRLRVQDDGRDDVQDFDINAHYEGRLQLHLVRLGPRDALALIQIDGLLNTISVGTLVDAIDQLTAARVSRFVVTFGDAAADLDEPLGSWLRQTAQGVQTSRTYAMFPAVASTIREMHVAEIPGYRRSSGEPHVHEHTAAAVEDALASALQRLTTEELVRELTVGHPLSQAAALVCAGAQLPPERLPLLIERAAAEDRLIRRGALIALSGSSEPAALRELIRTMTGADEDMAALAMECLAASRFPAAHRELAELLQRPIPLDQRTIIRVLTRYPRPDWTPYLARLTAPHSETDGDTRLDPDAYREVLRAYGQLGHPQLHELLAAALEHDDASVRETAFHLLLSRDETASDRLAIEYALSELDGTPPTPQMLQLFDRVRDPRIAPRLIAIIDHTDSDRTAIINTLVRIGPGGTDELLAQRFANFKPNEQAAVIANLTQLRSPHLHALAVQGMTHEDDALFNAAVRALTLTSTAEAAELLRERLIAESNISRVNHLAKALEEIGTPESLQWLILARSQVGEDRDKRDVIVRRLQSLQLKSPGAAHLKQAERHVQAEEHEKAVEHYSHALDRDDTLTAAYSGRGHSWLKLEKFPEAAADFRRGIDTDPDDGLAVAGLGIALSAQGQVAEAVELIEESSARFHQDVLFAYNSACVYGRAIEWLSGQPASEASTDRLQRYRAEALRRLREAIELGFDDREWIKKDPDLASLRTADGFNELLVEPDKTPADENEAAPQEDAPPRKPLPEPGEQ